MLARELLQIFDMRRAVVEPGLQVVRLVLAIDGVEHRRQSSLSSSWSCLARPSTSLYAIQRVLSQRNSWMVGPSPTMTIRGRMALQAFTPAPASFGRILVERPARARGEIERASSRRSRRRSSPAQAIIAALSVQRRKRRRDERQARLARARLRAPSRKRCVRGDAARHHQRAQVGWLARAAAMARSRGAVDQAFHHRHLESGGEVGDALASSQRAPALRPCWRTAVFKPLKEKLRLRPALHRARQIQHRARRAARRALDRRAAGIAEAQQLRRLVEGFAGGVVDGGAEPAIAADAFDHQQLAMAAGDQQQQIGKGDVVGEPRGQRVAFQMIDREKRLAVHQRRSPCPSSRRR